MKILILLLLSVASIHAQNFSVLFYGTNASAGFPTNWPMQQQNIGINTQVIPPFVLLTKAQLDEVFETNLVQYTFWESNRNFQAKAKADSDLADFLAKMDKIEVWIDRTSGTNSLSNAQRDSAINDICQTFKKLRRALVNLYKPE